MPKLTVMTLAALCAAPVHAEIFKCAGKAGADVYQNFPCHLDSIGSVQTVQLPTTDATARSAASTRAAEGPPKVGMTAAEVTAIWGEPIDRYEDEQSKGRFQVWDYPGNRSVRFDHKRRVMAVQR